MPAIYQILLYELLDLNQMIECILLQNLSLKVSYTMVVVHNRDRPCICINPNRAHTLTPP